MNNDLNLEILIIICIITSGLSLIFSSIMILLYVWYRRLKNYFTKIFLLVMLSEAIFSLGKLISIYKLVLLNQKINELLCEIQGFIISFGEMNSIFWIVYLGISLKQLLMNHDFSNKINIRYFIIFSFTSFFLCNCLLFFFDQLGCDDNSKSVFCWIRIHTKNGDLEPVFFIMYGIYVLAIVFNIVITIQLKWFLNRISKIDQLSKNTNIELVSNNLSSLAIYTSTCYSFAILSRLLQTFELDLPSHDIVKFIVYMLQIILVNLKGFWFFFFCLDKEYRMTLLNIVLCRSEIIDIDVQIDKIQIAERTTIYSKLNETDSYI